MMLAPMQFRGFVWPHNPRVYTIDYHRQLAVHKVPFERYHIQDLGRSCRVLKGEGEFVGENAYEDFKRLACVFYEQGAGALIHPLWMATRAYFVALRVEQEPRPDYVRYSFEFWEERSGGETASSSGGGDSNSSSGGSSSGTVHVVRSGETLWGIASQYGIGHSELLNQNPWIKNPSLIYPGDRVVIS